MQYQEGQRLRGSDGKDYVVVGGVPRQAPSANAPSAPNTPAAAPAGNSPPAFIPGRPKPEKPRDPPSGYNWGPGGDLIPIPGGPADDNGGGDDAPSGYRWAEGGGALEPIPGGPAERGIAGNTVPGAVFEKADGYVSQYVTLANALDTFQDDFGGNWLGKLENTAQAYSPIPVGTAGQSEWWSGFKALDNQIRNDLFGSALTPTEKQAYSDTTIEPGMNPDKIKANLQRRIEIVEGALRRRQEFFKANGYKPEAVDAIFAPLSERQSQAAVDAQGEKPPRFGEGDGNIAGATRDNGDSTDDPTLSTDGTDRRDNPALAGVREEYIRRLGEGQNAEQIIRWAREAGIHPSAYRSIQEQVRFRQQNPQAPLNQYDTTQLDDSFVELGAFDNALNSFAQSGPGAALIAAGDAASGFTLDNIVGMTGGNAERARLGMGQVAEQSPVWSGMGTIAGGAMTALGGEAMLGARGMAAGMPRALAADSAYGAFAGAGASDDGNRLGGAALGALAGAGGSFLGQKTGNALAGMARGVTDPSVNALRQEGVNALTVGQTFGNSGRVGAAVKSVEDRLSGIPILGGVVTSRQSEGYRQLNVKAFDKALEPIGGTIGDTVGEDAIEKAQNLVSEAFRKALDGKGVTPDEVFEKDLTKAVAGVRSIKRLGAEVTDEIGEILAPYSDEVMLSGDALDDISRGLRDLKGRYMSDPLGVRLAKQIERVERSVFDMFDRQASGTVEEYHKARQAYRRVSTLEDAVMKARNQRDRMFTPAQLGQADRGNTRRYGGKRAAARGDSPFFDLQTAAQDVLPNQVPDSGTAGRILVPLALVGGGGGVDAATGGGVGTGLTIGTILAGLYSKTGQRILTKPGRGMADGTRRKAAMESDNTRRALGAAGGASGVALLPQQ